MQLNNFDKSMAAITFAEADESDTAREIMGGNASKKGTAPAPAHKPYGKTLILGAVSISAYVLLFSNERWVMENFTKGGIYTLLPVLTAFFFSFVHGPFGSNLLSSLGLEAKKK